MCVLFFFIPRHLQKRPCGLSPLRAKNLSLRGCKAPVAIRTPSPPKKKGETIMTFSDIFKSSFLENVTSVSVLAMVLALGLTVAFLYRKKG